MDKDCIKSSWFHSGFWGLSGCLGMSLCVVLNFLEKGWVIGQKLLHLCLIQSDLSEGVSGACIEWGGLILKSAFS